MVMVCVDIIHMPLPTYGVFFLQDFIVHISMLWLTVLAGHRDYVWLRYTTALPSGSPAQADPAIWQRDWRPAKVGFDITNHWATGQ